MAQYRSALGKPVDMTQLASKNENVRAVGNMKVNARGDTIDGHNRVIVPVTKKVGQAYERTVTNRAANIMKPNVPQQSKAQADIEESFVEEPMFEEFETADEAAEIEAIKADELKNFKIKPASEAPDFVAPETTSKKK